MLSSQAVPAGTRFAARIEYNGARFHGWQAQPQLDVPTVQNELESALAEIAGTAVRTHCAGRTDAGVHGFGQIVHFDDPVGRSPKAWVLGTNRYLSDAVAVHWAQPVPEHFHARFSAVSRRYRYVICNTPVRPASLHGQVSWYRHELDLKRMHLTAQCLLGEQDFSAFRAASCQASTPFRRVMRCDVARFGDLVIVDITANAFLHHMVRNIVGSLLAVGAGHQSEEWFREVLQGGDRTRAADTAPAEGLYLVAVGYPEDVGLPETPDGPTLLSALL